MTLLIPVIFLLFIIIILIKYRIKVDFPTFVHKGFRANRGTFGVFCFCGKQGSGKTFSTVSFLLKNQNKPIYSNIHLKEINHIYFSSFQEMLKIKQKDCIIVFDEIFSALAKNSDIDTKVKTFLSQQRKNRVVFITTAQEWLDIPITLRRYVRYQIDCSINNLLPFSLLIERYRDGDKMKWSNEDNEYIAPILATKISKMMKKITKLYDTFETIEVSATTPQSGVAEKPKLFKNSYNPYIIKNRSII